VSTTAGLDEMVKRKIPSPRSSSRSPVQYHWAMPAPVKMRNALRKTSDPLGTPHKLLTYLLTYLLTCSMVQDII
jgi:hypothetical protein